MLKNGDTLPLEVIYSFFLLKQAKSIYIVIFQINIYRQGYAFALSLACVSNISLSKRQLLCKLISKEL